MKRGYYGPARLTPPIRPAPPATFPRKGGRTLALVRIGHHAVQQADAEADAAVRDGRVLRILDPGGGGDVDVGPGVLVHVALQEQGGGDRAARPAVADVAHVGDLAVHVTVVAFGQRHAPDRLVHLR